MREVLPQESIFGFSGELARGLAVAVLMAAIAAVLVAIPGQSPEWARSEEFVRKLFLVPILLCASWFGSKGAAIGTAAATALSIGQVGSPWPAELPSQIQRIGEVAVFWLVGALAARFFDQQKVFLADIEAANDNTLLALASSLDVREHSTGVHSQRVADYMLRLAKEVGIGDRGTLDTVWRGALLHDVGKIGIPDDVLLKPGPLTDEEWRVMRMHPEVGAGILRKIDFLREPAEIVLSHHERFDGSGYPRGLRAESIPLAARMFAVIDVYDALTTCRSYHTACSHEEALKSIRDGAGSLFDPAVVKAFAGIPFEELREIARSNSASMLLGPGPAPALRETAFSGPVPS
ncbi:MAG: HD domain-containing phosphohydrolase [Thermodesulfobacteriota bacterium]